MDGFESFVVVINQEEQHALWPSELPPPDGWRVIFGPAPKQACLEHVDAVWKDIRPLSLRSKLSSAP